MNKEERDELRRKYSQPGYSNPDVLALLDALENAESIARAEGQMREDSVSAQIAYLRRAERAESECESLREALERSQESPHRSEE